MQHRKGSFNLGWTEIFQRIFVHAIRSGPFKYLPNFDFFLAIDVPVCYTHTANLVPQNRRSSRS